MSQSFTFFDCLYSRAQFSWSLCFDGALITNKTTFGESKSLEQQVEASKYVSLQCYTAAHLQGSQTFSCASVSLVTHFMRDESQLEPFTYYTCEITCLKNINKPNQ